MECAACCVFQYIDEYTRNQRSKGEGNARCRDCVEVGRFPQDDEDQSVYDGNYRVCVACRDNVHADHYSRNQWFKGDGNSRCTECVEEGRFAGDDSDSGSMSSTGTTYRTCATCSENLPTWSFTQNQLHRGVGQSKCKSCVERSVVRYRNCFSCSRQLLVGEFSRTQRTKGSSARCKICVQECLRGEDATARDNRPCRITYSDLRFPFASGTFRFVQRGKYVGGERTGQACVVKWFKNQPAISQEYFANDMTTVAEATELVRQWNEAGIIDSVIRVNQPDVIRFSDGPKEGEYATLEPFIENFMKFNSNSGWVASHSTRWVQVLQALSHFTFHVSRGNRLLCDIQGGLYRDGAILTDPVVMSNIPGKFGPTDFGPKGISTFFSNHRCNEFCKPGWSLPRIRAQVYAIRQGTSMMSSYDMRNL